MSGNASKRVQSYILLVSLSLSLPPTSHLLIWALAQFLSHFAEVSKKAFDDPRHGMSHGQANMDGRGELKHVQIPTFALIQKH